MSRLKYPIDISLPLNNETAIYWPGHPQIKRKEITGATGRSVITEFSMGTHTGTHLDAPKHQIPGAAPLDQIPLDCFIGTCRVLDFSKNGKSVTLNALKEKNIQKEERVLLRTTNSIKGFSEFSIEFVYLESRAAEYLAEIGIKLIGIDALSIVDFATYKKTGILDNISHTAFLERNIPILEGINLKDVPEGEYILSALPLRFEGIDGCPVRAVLLAK